MAGKGFKIASILTLVGPSSFGTDHCIALVGTPNTNKLRDGFNKQKTKRRGSAGWWW